MSAGAGPRFRVRVVDEVLAEDLARSTPAAKAAIEAVVATLREEGAVLTADHEAGKPALVLLAVGERHPAKPWKASVYEITHRRLHK